ncbi:MAG: glycosyltransferase [Dokdonella sp.]
MLAKPESGGTPPRCRFSFVIPTFNRSKLTLRVIGSILEQDSTHSVEIIVVNDGSTDDTEAALHQHFGEDLRVRVITTAHNYTNSARNTGFDAATGELVCFLDSDDFWTAHTLSTVNQVFIRCPELNFLSIDGSTLSSPNHPEVARVVAGDAPGWSHSHFRNASLTTRALILAGEPQPIVMLYGDYFPAIINGDLFYLSGLVIRRDAIARAGPFTEHFHFYNDWEFFARLCLQGIGGYINYDGFRRDAGRDDQISRGHPATAMPRRHLYILRSLSRRFPEQAANYKDVLTHALNDAEYWLARCLLQTHHRRLARRYLVHCVRQRYKTGRSLILLATSYLK